jgi:hypothetical protein
VIDCNETESVVVVRVSEIEQMSLRTNVSPTRRSSVRGTATLRDELVKVAEAWWSGSEGLNKPIMSVGLSLKSKMLSS